MFPNRPNRRDFPESSPGPNPYSGRLHGCKPDPESIDFETLRDIGESNRLMKEANDLASRASLLAADADAARDEANAKAERARDLRNRVCGKLFIGANTALSTGC